MSVMLPKKAICLVNRVSLDVASSFSAGKTRERTAGILLLSLTPPLCKREALAGRRAYFIIPYRPTELRTCYIHSYILLTPLTPPAHRAPKVTQHERSAAAPTPHGLLQQVFIALTLGQPPWNLNFSLLILEKCVSTESLLQLECIIK